MVNNHGVIVKCLNIKNTGRITLVKCLNIIGKTGSYNIV